MLLAWSITAVIVLLTLFWVVPIAALTPLLKLESIRKIWPQLAAALDKSELSRSLVNTVLPTVVVSLLNTAVPYLYDCKLTSPCLEVRSLN
jgi:calcium permeable stress-gated cation channel